MSEAIAEKIYQLGLLAKPPSVATGNVNKSIDHQKLTDMKHDSFEIVNTNDRQSRVKVATKEKLKRQRHTLFLGQE